MPRPFGKGAGMGDQGALSGCSDNVFVRGTSGGTSKFVDSLGMPQRPCQSDGMVLLLLSCVIGGVALSMPVCRLVRCWQQQSARFDRLSVVRR